MQKKQDHPGPCRSPLACRTNRNNIISGRAEFGPGSRQRTKIANEAAKKKKSCKQWGLYFIYLFITSCYCWGCWADRPRRKKIRVKFHTRRIPAAANSQLAVEKSDRGHLSEHKRIPDSAANKRRTPKNPACGWQKIIILNIHLFNINSKGVKNHRAFMKEWIFYQVCAVLNNARYYVSHNLIWKFQTKWARHYFSEAL